MEKGEMERGETRERIQRLRMRKSMPVCSIQPSASVVFSSKRVRDSKGYGRETASGRAFFFTGAELRDTVKLRRPTPRVPRDIARRIFEATDMSLGRLLYPK